MVVIFPLREDPVPDACEGFVAQQAAVGTLVATAEAICQPSAILPSEHSRAVEGELPQGHSFHELIFQSHQRLRAWPS